MIYEVVNLQKGGRIDLNKAAPGVNKFAFALGWDPQSYNGADFDLDATAFLTKNGKCISAADFVGYFTPGFAENGLKDYRGFASHSGDDKTGGTPGDDETITIDTSKIDLNQCDEIQFNVTIYEAKERKQTFGQVNNAFIRVYDPLNPSNVICRYDLTEDYCNDTAVVIGKLYFKDGTWRFQAVGGGFKDGLSGLVGAVGLATIGG